MDEVKEDEKRRAWGCGFCEGSLGNGGAPLCPSEMGYLTREEEEILLAMKEIKDRARFVLGKIRGLREAQRMERGEGAQGSEFFRSQMEECMKELETLRTEWKLWEVKLEKAKARKMALLGHGPWEDVGD